MTDVLRKKEHGWFRFNDGPESWSMPDPTDDARCAAVWKCRYNMAALTQHECFLLAEVYDAFHHLCTHPGGTKYTQGQLAALRRALRDTEEA